MTIYATVTQQTYNLFKRYFKETEKVNLKWLKLTE